MSDPVDKPSHYTDQYPLEAIEIIRKVLTPDEFRGYCFGNMLKYKLRAGAKGDPLEDIKKAFKYREFMQEK